MHMCQCIDPFVRVHLWPALFCKALGLVHPSGVCCVCSCTCASACFELALVTMCSQQSSVVHMHVGPWCVCCSAVLPSSVVSGLSPPSYPPLFPLFIFYQYDGCPFSLLCMCSWLGCQDLPAMGGVSSRSWLLLVEAPGCLGHSTSI